MTKKLLVMMLSLLMVLSMAVLTGCGSNDSADSGENEATDVVAEDVEEPEEPAAPDLESLDEIQGHYEMRPLEIWNTTAEVTDPGEGYYLLHITGTDNEYYYGLSEDGNAFYYDASSGELTEDLLYTYTFEKGVIALTTLDEQTTMSLKKEGAE